MRKPVEHGAPTVAGEGMYYVTLYRDQMGSQLHPYAFDELLEDLGLVTTKNGRDVQSVTLTVTASETS